MSSCWGKLLVRDLVVPAGGWDWAWSEGGSPQVATLPAGSYDTILDLAEELRDQIDLVNPPIGSTIVLSEVGITTIIIPGMTATDWPNTDDSLSSLLGFDETETVTGNTVISSGQHQYGWYPGAITHNWNPNKGAGLASGNRWRSQDASVSTTAGSGRRRRIRPGRTPRIRLLRFDLLYRDEVRDRTIGVDALQERFFASRFSWYPDRTLGQVGTPGTTGDPRTLTDADVDYWVVTLQDQPTDRERTEHPDWYEVELTLNGEPGP